MCDSVSFPDGTEAQTVAELAAKLGVSPDEIVWKGCYSCHDAAGCLCQVDVPATARKHGWLSFPDAFGWFVQKQDEYYELSPEKV